MKKPTTKLSLNKETITKLNLANMSEIKGGNNGGTRGAAAPPAGGATQASLSAGTAIPTCAG